MFKKFNRFDRPDRRALLRSKLFGNRPRPRPFGKKPNLDQEETNKIEDKENNEEEKSSKKPNFPIDNVASPSALVLSAINDEDTLQVENNRRGSETVKKALRKSCFWKMTYSIRNLMRWTNSF